LNTRVSSPEASELLCPHCGQSHQASYTHCPNTGKPLHTGRALIGRVIAERYRIVGLLGEGGMGAVYVADHLRIGRKVAIKRLHPELANDEKAVQRFQREARAAGATGHEHIVEILDLGYAEDGAPYLVMEYLRGLSLKQTLEREGKLPMQRACRIVGQVLAALAAVHEHGIVHRDLKPDNVFLTRRGNDADWVKVLDFGISKMKHEDEALELTRTGVTMGTPYYMSPEQARGSKNVDHRVDLYAVGVMLHECLTGKVPYAGENYLALVQQILRNDAPRPSNVVAGIPKELDDIVVRALSKEPGDRFPSALVMLEALLPFGAERPEPRRDEPRADPFEPPPLSDVRTRADLAPMTEIAEPPTMTRVGRESEMPRPSSSGTGIARPGSIAARAAELTAKAGEASGREPTAPRIRPPTVASSVTSASSKATVPGRDRRPAPPAAAPDGPRDSGAREKEPSAPRPVAVTGTAPARYFFASSDDWIAERAPSIVPLGRQLTGDRAPGPTSALRDVLVAATELGTPPRPSARAAPIRPPTEVPREPTRERGDATQPRLELGRAEGTPVMLARDGGADDVSRRAGVEANVKGAFVSCALEDIETTHGPEGLQQVLARLDPGLRGKLEGVILPMAWHPLAVLEALVRCTEEVFGRGDGALCERVGRACADRELPTTHRLFMQSATPSAAVDRIPLLHRAYFARGDVRVLSSGPNAARVSLEGTSLDTPHLASWAVGFVTRLVELSGGREVKVLAGRTPDGKSEARGVLSLRWR
jgi:serine/threonine-protein kinase